MYCDFCGKKPSYNAKYCRYCGQKLKEYLGDTQPLPIVSEAILHGYNAKHQIMIAAPEPWYKSIVPKKTAAKRSKVWQIAYDLFALGVLAGLIYILATFKTIQEYQGITSLWGIFWIGYIWWKR